MINSSLKDQTVIGMNNQTEGLEQTKLILLNVVLIHCTNLKNKLI